MLVYDGFRLIGIKEGSINGFIVENGTVSYQPEVKYKIEKRNAFNPTIIIKRQAYNEDNIDCQAFLKAEEYNNLVNFLTESDSLYIEFDTKQKTMQLPIYTFRLPKLEDDNRSFKGAVKFSFKSLYTTLTPIDFENIFGYGNNYGFNYGF